MSNRTKSNLLKSFSNFVINYLNASENQSIYCEHNEYCMPEDEYFDQILSHIFPTTFEWCLIVAYFLVFVGGLVGNFVVCFVVFRNKAMRTVTNYFIVNLAVADELVLFVCLPVTVLGDVTETWFLGRVACKIINFLQGVSVSTSVLTLCCISVERWYAICHPLKFKATPKRAKVMIGMTWILSSILLLPEIIALDLDTTRVKPQDFTILLTNCKSSWSYATQTAYQIFLIVALYLAPFVLMSVTYFQMARQLWSTPSGTGTNSNSVYTSARWGTGGVRDSGTTVDDRYRGTTKNSTSTFQSSRCVGPESQLLARRKVAKMMMAVVVVFGVCYLPVHLLNILRYLKVMSREEGVSSNFALIAHWLCYFNSAINPAIYNLMSAKYRAEFLKACKALCCCLRIRRRGNKSPTYTNSPDLTPGTASTYLGVSRRPSMLNWSQGPGSTCSPSPCRYSPRTKRGLSTIGSASEYSCRETVN